MLAATLAHISPDEGKQQFTRLFVRVCGGQVLTLDVEALKDAKEPERARRGTQAERDAAQACRRSGIPSRSTRRCIAGSPPPRRRSW